MILRAGIFYDGTLAPPRRNVDVQIEGERIAAISAAAEGVDPDRTAECLTPGLVNAHVHLEMNGEPDYMTLLATTTPGQRLLRAVETARKALRAGITTVRDLGASHSIAIDVRDAINAGRIPGPNIRAAGAVLCMTGGHGGRSGASSILHGKRAKPCANSFWLAPTA